MSTHLTAQPPYEPDDDCDAYVLMDPRAALLDQLDEPPPMERPRWRGAQLRAAQDRGQDVEWRALLGARRQFVVAAAPSLWQRLTRRLRRES